MNTSLYMDRTYIQDELKIIWILAIGLSIACSTGYLAQRLKLPPVLGYLLAGYLIGPNSPGFIADQSISDQLATIGITLLMFAVGLNFNWRDINPVKKIVVPGALILSTLSIFAGILLSIGLGENITTGFVIGVAICVSSTVIIVRILTDQHLLHSQQGYLVIGWTIIEDLVSVFGLILLPSLSFSSLDTTDPRFIVSLFYSITLVILKIIILGIIIYFIGEKSIEKILKLIAKTRSHELFTIAILAYVFLIAVGSSYLFGISLALGAFIAGTVIGKTELSHQAAANALPMRDAFTVIFFLSVGMLFNPAAIQNDISLFLGILAIILIFRPLIAFIILKFAKYPSYIAFTLALAISQIGEYSFILAEEGSLLKILPDYIYDIIIACAFISIALNPVLFQLFQSWINPNKQDDLKNRRDVSLPLQENENLEFSFLPKALVIGYGSLGKIAAHYLTEKYKVLVIDQNIDKIAQFQEKNIKMLFGDATQLQILEQAAIENMHLVVITTPDFYTTESIIKVVQHVNPSAKVIARIHFISDYEKMKFRHIPIICDEKLITEKMIHFIHNL